MAWHGYPKSIGKSILHTTDINLQKVKPTRNDDIEIKKI